MNNDPIMNPIVQRWHYLEWLDGVVKIAFSVAVAVWFLVWLMLNKRYPKWTRRWSAFGEAVMLGFLGYAFWRMFCSWNGYY